MKIDEDMLENVEFTRKIECKLQVGEMGSKHNNNS